MRESFFVSPSANFRASQSIVLLGRIDIHRPAALRRTTVNAEIAGFAGEKSASRRPLRSIVSHLCLPQEHRFSLTNFGTRRVRTGFDSGIDASKMRNSPAGFPASGRKRA
jgi:hypothetical protein